MHSTQIVVIFFFISYQICVECSCLNNKTFDYIIVGAGTTGSIVAARLSESNDTSVLVLEAGQKPPLVAHIPFLSREVFRTQMNWNYKTKPQKNCCKILKHQSLPIIAGKGLGGTSSLDFMIYTKGNRKDYDQWLSLGNDQWGYQQLLPYFRMIEDYRVPQTEDQAEYHNQNGPIPIERPSFRSPMSDIFLKAGHQLGYHLVDVNGKDQTGFMNPPLFLHNGFRCCSYSAYLKTAMKRCNIRVVLKALVTKIIINRFKRAVGVKYMTENGEMCEVSVRQEIIISAGVFNTPKILILSGIGPKDILKKHNIPVKKNAPGVGQNLQDHVTVNGLTFYINQSDSFNFNRFTSGNNLDLWRITKTGPLTSSGSYEGIAFYKSRYTEMSEDWPDIEILFKSDNVLQHDTINLPVYLLGYLPEDSKDVVTFYPILLRPKSRGFVTINSTDPTDPPIIDPNYLSHPDDIKILLEGWRFVWKITQTGSFRKYSTQLFNSGIFPRCLTDMFNKHAYENCIVRTMAYTAHNPVGTCKMGPNNDPMAVVDNQLRVRGINGLRIADASVMPTIVSGHPRTACIVIGEKLAALIKNSTKN